MSELHTTAWIAGATGLVGSHVLPLLVASPRFARVVSFTRRPLAAAPADKHENRVVDFDQLPTGPDARRVNVAFCCLGTTMKQAGSQAAFRRVDYEYVVTFARYARASGATHFLLISALNADARARVFYSRVKGEADDAVSQLGFEQVTIVRPSLLIGERSQQRLGESVMAPISKLLPRSVRGIEADTVARAMVALAERPTRGVRIVKSGELFTLAP